MIFILLFLFLFLLTLCIFSGQTSLQLTNLRRLTSSLLHLHFRAEMESDSGVTKSDIKTNKLRIPHRRMKQISTNTSIPEAKLKEIRNVDSDNGVWSSGILKSPETMAGEERRSLITGKDKKVYKQDNNSPTKLNYGSISVIGRRREMEDTVKIEPEIIPGNFAFFGVYDGHGGPSVADSCRDRLHRLLEEELVLAMTGEGIDWTNVITTCFSKMDDEIGKDKYGVVITREKITAGSTATVVIVGVDEMVVANCGDSRAVLSRGGIAVPLSIDHKPNRADEKKRVEEAGGRVIDWNGYRVQGVLAMSRSIGASYMGREYNSYMATSQLSIINVMYGFMAVMLPCRNFLGDHYLRPFIISEPTVTINKRTDSDEFLILATDGLWDVMSNEAACDVVRKCFNGRTKKRFPDHPSATDVAAFLAEVAIAQGSEDNISIIVVDLKMGS